MKDLAWLVNLTKAHNLPSDLFLVILYMYLKQAVWKDTNNALSSFFINSDKLKNLRIWPWELRFCLSQNFFGDVFLAGLFFKGKKARYYDHCGVYVVVDVVNVVVVIGSCFRNSVYLVIPKCNQSTHCLCVYYILMVIKNMQWIYY